MTNNEHSAMYDWRCTLEITLNGQLYLLKHAEMQMDAIKDIKVDMLNTDGATYVLKDEDLPIFEEVNKLWEALTLTELESVDYEVVIKNSINDYLAFYYDKKGNIKTKEKGFFVTEPVLTSSKDFLVIPKIVNKYYLHKHFKNELIDVAKEVKEHANVYDFCSSAKINRDYEVTYDGKVCQQLNRYYVGLNGSYLYKKKYGKQEYESVMKETKVSLLNQRTEEINDFRNLFNIDYKYYIDKINEQVLDGVVIDDVKIDKGGQVSMF